MTPLQKAATGIPQFTALHFTVVHGHCVFTLSKICGNPDWSRSIGAIFPTAYACFMSPCHVLVISHYFKCFHCDFMCYGDLWSIIFDVAIVVTLGTHETHPHKTGIFINIVCVFWWLHHQALLLALFLSSGLPILWDTIILKLSELIILQWPQNVLMKGSVVIPHFKSKARND